ncbi:MAG: hypothetical protein AB1513_05025 [Pseudomonadota bacterium]
MAADLNTLTPEFRKQVRQLLMLCEQHGVLMRPYFAVRSPLDQPRQNAAKRNKQEAG